MVSARQFSRLFTLVLAVALAVALLPAQPRAEAAIGGSIRYGETVTGQITATNYFEVWEFQGTRGDRVQILMEGDGYLDPYLGLLVEDTEAVVMEDDDSGGGSNAYIEATLPVTGAYVIVATRYGLENGTSVGAYRLTLRAVGAAANVNANAVSTAAGTSVTQPVELDTGIFYMGPVELGTPITGTLDDRAFAHIYELQASAGTQIAMLMMADASALDSYIYFTNENFDVLAEDDDSGSAMGLGQRDAFLSLTVPQTGTYYAVATRAGGAQGTTSGGYVLLLGVPESDSAPAAQPNTQPQQPAPQQAAATDLPPGVSYAGSIAIGGTANGQITATDFVHLYDMEGTAGQEVTVIMRGMGGLDAYVGLMTPDGDVLAEDDNSAGGLDARITIRLPESGTYLIAATRSGIDNGTTVGSYTLQVSAGQAAPVNSAPSGLSGFGSLPGRAIATDVGTFYLRGNGASPNPEKSPPFEAFLGLDSRLPGMGARLFPPAFSLGAFDVRDWLPQ